MNPKPKEIRNIAILAHVDAGKTTVSERLLYFSDTIPGLGEVDEGLATMDYLEEERKRGITIEAGIASYTWKKITVTFVDTPGHVDFGVEVDFALQAVEGVVLALSGISGIESQSLEAWEKIKAHGNLPLIFINKLDLPTADYRKVLDQIRLMFNVEPFCLTLPVLLDGKIDGVVDVINQLALYRSVDNPRKLIKGAVPTRLLEEYESARGKLLDIASQYNDELLQAFVNGQEIRSEALVAGIRGAMASGKFAGVYMGSALKNVGIRQLMNGINLFLPPPATKPELEKVKGLIIKIRFYQRVGKIYLAKLYAPMKSGELDSIRLFRVFAESLQRINEAEAGEIVAIRSDRNHLIGEYLEPSVHKERIAPEKYHPLLQARIELADEREFELVDQTLKQLAEAEPSISIEPDPALGGWLISTVGELQLDVFAKRLRKDYKCNINIGAPTVRYYEKLKAPVLGASNATWGQGHKVSLTLDFYPEDGNEETLFTAPDWELAQEHREVIESTFHRFCEQGVCGYGKVAALRCELKNLVFLSTETPLPLLAKCFSDCLGLQLSCQLFEVFEPIMSLQVIVPDEFCGAVLSDLAARGGIIRKMDSDGYNSIILLEIPLERTFGYTTLLRSLTKGMGVYVLTYEKHGVKKRI